MRVRSSVLRELRCVVRVAEINIHILLIIVDEFDDFEIISEIIPTLIGGIFRWLGEAAPFSGWLATVHS